MFKTLQHNSPHEVYLMEKIYTVYTTNTMYVPSFVNKSFSSFIE